MSSTAKAGRTTYRIRYKPSKSSTGKPLVVSGYGVELALKRTDYIVIDDREAANGEDKGDGASVSGTSDGDLPGDEMQDLKPLSTSEIYHLSMKAASFVMSHDDPFKSLISVSQDFPRYSSAISARNATTDFITEFLQNRDLFLPAGYNIIWINGVQVDPRNMDAFSLLDLLRRERKLINSLKGLGLTGTESVKLLSHSAIAQAKVEDEPQRYDYRDAEEGGRVIIWLNDLEKDKRYQGWPKSPAAVSSFAIPEYTITHRYLAPTTYIPRAATYCQTGCTQPSHTS